LRSELLFEFDITLIDTEFFGASNNGLFLLKRRIAFQTLRLLVDLIYDKLSPLLCLCYSLDKLLEPFILFDVSFLDFLYSSHLVFHKWVIDHNTLSLSSLSSLVCKFVAHRTNSCYSHACSLASNTGLVFIDVISNFYQAVSIRVFKFLNMSGFCSHGMCLRASLLGNDEVYWSLECHIG